jgi:hypothetical protein
MNRSGRLTCGLLGVAVGAGLHTGCVERRYLITTDQPGAIVYENGRPIGATPVDRSFVYYGKYRFTIVKDGCQMLVVDERLKAPWFEYPLVDFLSENLLPFTIRDIRRLHYTLQPTPIVPPDAVLSAGQQLRARGQNIGVPLPAPVPAAPVPVVPSQPAATPP